MLTYKFDTNTKEYLYAEEAFLDPLETEQQGKGIYLLPADSTFTIPLEPKEGFTVCWNNGEWEYIEDHRQTRDEGGVVVEGSGTPYWMPGDTWESPARYMAEPGPLPEGAMLARPEKPGELVRQEALSRIDSATSTAILAGFDHEVEGESLHFSYDSFDQQNFADSANVVSLSLSGVEGLPASVTWNAYRRYTPETGGELVRLTLDPQAFLALYTSGALVHKATQMEIGGQRKAAVEAAQTVEEINALLAGWGIA